jgi:hypothetical protein
MRLATLSSVIVSALAIAATAASAQVPHEFGQATTARPAVRSTLAEQTSFATPAISRAAEAAQIAAHNRAEALKQRALAYSLPRTAPYSIANASEPPFGRPVPGTAPAVVTPSDDFDYGDAEIGAAIATAIAALITAGALGLRSRSQPGHS